ncbi:hypothetical protein GCM10023213_34820 [Prosthecobacter algae]|uniref:Uncharacterized protein n=1 Tax=Prosthecobacter algae TaxID=1144682 RepID=A0ABP9PEL9_9BACT
MIVIPSNGPGLIGWKPVIVPIQAMLSVCWRAEVFRVAENVLIRPQIKTATETALPHVARGVQRGRCLAIDGINTRPVSNASKM